MSTITRDHPIAKSILADYPDAKSVLAVVGREGFTLWSTSLNNGYLMTGGFSDESREIVKNSWLPGNDPGPWTVKPGMSHMFTVDIAKEA